MATRLFTSTILPGLRRTVTRRFHNGPPKNPRGENPWPYPKQKVVFFSGAGALTASCFFAYSVDLFKPKFGELDWDKIRAERNARRAEEMDDDEDEEEDEDEDEE